MPSFTRIRRREHEGSCVLIFERSYSLSSRCASDGMTVKTFLLCVTRIWVTFHSPPWKRTLLCSMGVGLSCSTVAVCAYGRFLQRTTSGSWRVVSGSFAISWLVSLKSGGRLVHLVGLAVASARLRPRSNRHNTGDVDHSMVLLLILLLRRSRISTFHTWDILIVSH